LSKFIFITGGVVSGLGKGILTASIGALVKARGLSATMLKFDPYLNVDAGTMSPYQHGEVFVLNDGAETDLDLGHYERFIDEDLTRLSNVTSGKIYSSVITRERRGEYLGATVQMIPHVTDEIKQTIRLLADESTAEVLVIEIGGTVGDIEGLPFLEAIRQFRRDYPPQDVLYIHTTLVPFLDPSGEQKTKPTQHSVRELRGIGIQPDVIVCRSNLPISGKMRNKVALFCDVQPNEVISLPDLESIYRVPIFLEQEGLAPILDRFIGKHRKTDLSKWERLDRILESIRPTVQIGLVGKYVGMRDTYISVTEAIKHAGFEVGVEPHVKWIDAEKFEKAGTEKTLNTLDGIIVPGGFDNRGVEGKILAIRYAREQQMPFLGLCLGMQCAVIEFARNVCGLQRANSTEFDTKTPDPVIYLLPNQRRRKEKGGTMRLGAFPCRLKIGSKAHQAYGLDVVQERHRHRYELNNRYRMMFEKAGLIVSGNYEEKNLAEVMEITDHPWFVGSQFHPELTSRPGKANPLFRQFVDACSRRAEAKWKSS